LSQFVALCVGGFLVAQPLIAHKILDTNGKNPHSDKALAVPKIRIIGVGLALGSIFAAAMTIRTM
jgi:hypothetical protein